MKIWCQHLPGRRSKAKTQRMSSSNSSKGMLSSSIIVAMVNWWNFHVRLRDLMTHPFVDAASLAQGSLRSGDTVSYTAVAFAKAPELSTHFLGKKSKQVGQNKSIQQTLCECVCVWRWRRHSGGLLNKAKNDLSVMVSLSLQMHLSTPPHPTPPLSSTQTAARVTQTARKVICKSQQCQIESEDARRWWDHFKVCREARRCGEGGSGGLRRLEQSRLKGSSGAADVLLQGEWTDSQLDQQRD